MALPESRPHPPAETERNSWDILFGSYLPPRVVSNKEIASWNITTASGRLLTADDILQKVGVETRRVAGESETVLSMGIDAAAPIVERVGRIDGVIFSSSYPTGIHNATALTDEYDDLPEASDAVDIHAACSGAAVGLTVLKSDEVHFVGKRVLLVASEKYSPTLPDLRREEDPSLSQTIFSDGAYALSFVYGKDLTVLGYKRYNRSSFPQGSEETIRMPIDERLIRDPAFLAPVPQSTNGKFFMDGQKVYRIMQQIHPQQVMETIESVGLSPDNIALVIPHQASLPMLNAIAKGLPSLRDKLFFDLEEGNFSSASILKAFQRAYEGGRIKPGDIVVFDGFGAGLYASIVVAKLG